jgi:uncharacterized protein
MNTRTWIVAFLCLLGVLSGFAPAAKAQATYPPRPAEGTYIADAANLIGPEDKVKIRAACEQLQSAQGIPLMVATISSMADYGASGWQIERYAMNLFDEWGIGHSGRNAGILLLVSKNDRKVRIEMGAAWTHDKDALASSVINNTMVPRFKAGQYSDGIREGVEALAKQIGAPPAARAQSAPSPSPGGTVPGAPRGFVPSAPLHSTGLSGLLGPLACIIIPIIFIVLISIVSRIGRGFGGGYGGGYGPVGWGGGWGGGGGGFLSGALLGGLLGNAWGSRNSGGGGGGWFGGGSSGGGFGGGGFGGGGGGGGSFGGGFSGGGGATGSW